MTVFAPRDSYSIEDGAAWMPLQPLTFKTLGPRPAGFAPGIGAAMLESDLDILQLHGIWQFISAQTAQWAINTGRPTIISPHGMLDPWAIRQSAAKKKLAHAFYEGANFRRAHCFRALNVEEARAIRAFGIKNPIAVIPNGIDVDDDRGASPQVTEMPDWRAEGRRAMLFLGRIHKKKGLIETIRAWAAFKRIAPAVAQGWVLVIAGWGDERYLEQCKVLAHELGLTREVRFVGALFGADKASALRSCSAVVLNSFSEGLPMAVLEAWAKRKPVFMSRQCNLSEGFDEGAAIEVFADPVRTGEIFASCLGQLGESFGARGYSLVVRHYAWSSVCQRFEDLYSGGADGATRPHFMFDG